MKSKIFIGALMLFLGFFIAVGFSSTIDKEKKAAHKTEIELLKDKLYRQKKHYEKYLMKEGYLRSNIVGKINEDGTVEPIEFPEYFKIN